MDDPKIYDDAVCRRAVPIDMHGPYGEDVPVLAPSSMLHKDRRSREDRLMHEGMILARDPAERKSIPITSGVLDYFPLAIAYVARISKAGNDQHNPGQPLHWARGKSTDHADCIARHLIDRGTNDTDGLSHTGKLAWRALALLQEELEARALALDDPFRVQEK